MAYKALLIGISEYEDSRLNLTTVKNDILGYRSVLEKSMIEYEIEIIDDQTKNAEVILSKLHNFLNRCFYDDTVFVFWGGHGTYSSLKTFDSYITFETISELLNNCDSTTFLAIFDACYSGNINFIPSRTGSNLALNIKGEGKVVITSCSTTQESFDHEEYGLFTYYVLEGLNGKACDELNNVTVGSLFEYICKKIDAYTNEKGLPRQTPVKMGIEQGVIILNKMQYYQSHNNYIQKVSNHPSFKYIYQQLSTIDKLVLKSNIFYDYSHYDLANCIAISGEDKRPKTTFCKIPVALCNFYIKENVNEEIELPQAFNDGLKFPNYEIKSCLGYNFIPSMYRREFMHEDLVLSIDNLMRLNLMNINSFENDFSESSKDFIDEFVKERKLLIDSHDIIIQTKTLLLTDFGMNFIHYIKT